MIMSNICRFIDFSKTNPITLDSDSIQETINTIFSLRDFKKNNTIYVKIDNHIGDWFYRLFIAGYITIVQDVPFIRKHALKIANKLLDYTYFDYYVDRYFNKEELKIEDYNDFILDTLIIETLYRIPITKISNKEVDIISESFKYYAINSNISYTYSFYRPNLLNELSCDYIYYINIINRLLINKTDILVVRTKTTLDNYNNTVFARTLVNIPTKYTLKSGYESFEDMCMFSHYDNIDKVYNGNHSVLIMTLNNKYYSENLISHIKKMREYDTYDVHCVYTLKRVLLYSIIYSKNK